MTTRREWLLATVILTGCATPGRPLQEAFPSSLSGGWTLRKTEVLPEAEAPADIRSMGVRRAARAEYSGPAVITLTLREMKSPGNAFEAVQKWRPAENRMGFHHGRYFGVAEGATHPVLQQFVNAFDKTFGGE